jgi:hypothetical protein
MGLFDFANPKSGLAAVPFAGRKLAKLFQPIFGPDEDTPHPITSPRNIDTFTTMTSGDIFSSVSNLWKVHTTRKSVWQDIELMDTTDDTVSTALDITADHVASYDNDGINYRFESEDPKALKILTALGKRLDFAELIWQISRDAEKQGTHFREVVIDRNLMQVSTLKQTISYKVYPNTNDKGDKIPGWIYREDKDIYNNETGQRLAEWQIVPFIFGSRTGYLAVPILASSRRNWNRLAKIEDGMAIARLTRAYDKYCHRIHVEKEMSREDVLARIKLYKDNISKRRMLDSDGMVTQTNSPMDVMSDFYLPTTGDDNGGIELLTGSNSQLGNLNDVIYHREKLLTRLQVPLAYLQITSAQKTHTGGMGKPKSDVELMFLRTVARLRRSVLKGLRKVCDMELMLNGIVPAEDLYEIVLAPLSTSDEQKEAEITLTYAQAAVYFVEAFGALPPEFLAEKFLRLDKDQSAILDTFLGTYSKRLTTAKVKGVENAAKPKSTGGAGPGAGNHNESIAARKSEQIGGSGAKKEQGVPLEDLVDLIYDLQDEVRQDLVTQGLDVPDMDESYRNAIRMNVMNFAERQDLELVD